MDFLKPSAEALIVFQIKEETCDCFKCHIAEVTENEKIIIEPLTTRSHKILKIGTPVEIIISSENTLYSLKSQVSHITDSSQEITMTYPSNYQKIQRREYTRVNIELPIDFSIVTANPDLSQKAFRSVTVDMSGGGVSFISPLCLDKNTLIVMNMKLHNIEFSFTASVVRCWETGRKHNRSQAPEFMTATHFAKIDKGSQLTIIQTCFKRQLELKHLGLTK